MRTALAAAVQATPVFQLRTAIDNGRETRSDLNTSPNHILTPEVDADLPWTGLDPAPYGRIDFQR